MTCAPPECLQEIQPADAHAKAPQIPSTNHQTCTHKPGDQAHFPNWKILCAENECIPSVKKIGFSFKIASFTASENRMMVTTRWLSWHAKQHLLRQHTMCYRDFNATKITTCTVDLAMSIQLNQCWHRIWHKDFYLFPFFKNTHDWIEGDNLRIFHMWSIFFVKEWMS